MIRVRFAPSPHGLLFISGARVALANFLFARRNGGTLTLRFDDLDTNPTSSIPASTIQADTTQGGIRQTGVTQAGAIQAGTSHADRIMQDLQWLGIAWDDCIHQSARLDLYQDAIVRLKEMGVLYPCFESEEELRAKQEFRRKRKQPLIYDRSMLSLTTAQRQAAEAGGKHPHWRLRLSDRSLEWRDMIMGERRTALTTISDPVLVRADETPMPILASVVDDIAGGTTHIIRGEDNAGNTAIQIELFEALTGAAASVRFAHLPAIIDSRTTPGRRVGSRSVRGLRGDGVEPCAITACLAGGLPGPDDPLPMEALAARFELADLAATKFDAGRMLTLNRRVLRRMEFAAVADRLPGGATEAFWQAVRGSLDLLKEARGWWDVVAGTIVPPVVEGERALLTTAEALLPPEPWDGGIWAHWIAALEQATGRAGNTLLLPLRLALTGEDTGPDLADLLPLIGRPRAANRLLIAAA